MATSINLAPGTQYVIEARKRRQRLYAAAMIIMAAVIGAWIILGVFRWQLQKAQVDVNNRIAAIDTEISKLDEDAKRIVLFEERLVQLDSLLDTHVSWNPLLTEIERLLPSTTVLTSFNVDAKQAIITITGNTPDVDQVAVALASLTSEKDRKTAFSKTSIDNIVRKEERASDNSLLSVRYEFSAQLTFDPTILYVNQ